MDIYIYLFIILSICMLKMLKCNDHGAETYICIKHEYFCLTQINLKLS